jgi:lantibiotic biosynthesis protein
MSSDDRFLATAAGIGRRIVTDAIWERGRCSWMGAVADPKRPSRAVYHALGPALYDGTAGVGLFLAHLAALTRDRDTRITAIGALRHALERTSSIHPRARPGFHAGLLGIAWAGTRAATVLGVDELDKAARMSTDVEGPLVTQDRGPDVILGTAGSVIAQLGLHEELGDKNWLERARATGADLLGLATITRHGWSWATTGHRHRNHLCGLSHGAAGIGWALMELFAVTGETRFLGGAEGAFQYERSWVDPTSGTWPDLRIGGQRRGATAHIASPAIGTWCHGEAGIALTRLRAIQILGKEPFERDASLALEATGRVLRAGLGSEIRDLTLCHGASGSADVLLAGKAALVERPRDATRLAQAVGDAAIERYGATGRGWPCDAGGGQNPGLFRGLSGIAWFYLRLHNRSLPSPLSMPISG